jgi:DNA polymerase sigma
MATTLTWAALSELKQILKQVHSGKYLVLFTSFYFILLMNDDSFLQCNNKDSSPSVLQGRQECCSR